MTKRMPYLFESISKETPLYWRSLEEKERLHDPALEGERAVEFKSEQLPGKMGRRGFLEVMGSIAALAGAAGCRRPIQRIVPYTKMPEQVIPGVPARYATAYACRGEVLGLVVESHEGRPTKVEGNPDHPASLGAASLHAQASVLDLYDPDRSEAPRHRGAVTIWSAFDADLQKWIPLWVKDGGAKLRFLFQPASSPTLIRLQALVKQRFPNAVMHSYEPIDRFNAWEGGKLAFGRPVQVHARYDYASVVVSVDSDFLQTEGASTLAARRFANGRRLRQAGDPMSRLYVIESAFTLTGTNADHRVQVAPSQIEGWVIALAKELAEKHGVDFGDLSSSLKEKDVSHMSAFQISVVAQELVRHRGKGIVVAGWRQSPLVHALVHAINQGLANVGNGIEYTEPIEKWSEANVDIASVQSLKTLVEAMRGGQVDALVIMGGNPVYDAPADLRFGDALSSVAYSVHLSSHYDETSERCLWHLPRSHALEAWGDCRSEDGTLAVQQPLIAPLYQSHSEIELLAEWLEIPEKDGYKLVRATWDEMARASVLGSQHWSWARLLRDGVASGTALPPLGDLELQWGAVQQQLAAWKAEVLPSSSKLEVVFIPCPKMMDGRYANNAWLAELPDPLTKLVWDNAALLSKKTADVLNVRNGDKLRLQAGEREITVGAWILPGIAEHVIVLHLGWGRTRAGRVGNGIGFDVYPLRSASDFYRIVGVRVSKEVGARHHFVQTQTHDSMEGRPVAREANYEEYKKSPHFPFFQAPPPRALPLWEPVKYEGYKWGMSIDLTACTGCNACVVACQAENNIAVVGKEQVDKGRILHWIRVDRYFLGDEESPQVAYQPLACVQCEDAPCENVCPVNATVHSPEGLNDMVYNRCIGTRYCANNCPYKVRRFNYLNFEEEFWKSPHAPETIQMARNPNVTVRIRGVMEKCTYCVQRIQVAKIEAKEEEHPIRDGAITPACAQSCPTEAIVFGDLNDPNSRVAALRKVDRRYELLAEIGTRPRTSYLAKVRNPNPEVKG
ncbi:4Fe-4S dicluster domain-containing protein [Pajaroellobacter abortibovis]|nr:4Fe-4S dicluster domain-containing protein [Pajaroellobacter abortibovis]